MTSLKDKASRIRELADELERAYSMPHPPSEILRITTAMWMLLKEINKEGGK